MVCNPASVQSTNQRFPHSSLAIEYSQIDISAQLKPSVTYSMIWCAVWIPSFRFYSFSMPHGPKYFDAQIRRKWNHTVEAVRWGTHMCTTTCTVYPHLRNLKLKYTMYYRFQMRDAYWTTKRSFNICPISVVHFKYFRAYAFGIFQLVSVSETRMSAII